MEKPVADLESAILARQFELADGGCVDVFFWTPETTGDDYFTCRYLIKGMGADMHRLGHGVDAFDAIMSAMQVLGTILYASEKYKNGELTWLGSRDLHLPLLPGEKADTCEYEKAELLTLVSQLSVVVMPGDKFPYIACPGERLHRLILRLTAIAQSAAGNAEIGEQLNSLISALSKERSYYEAVSQHAGLQLSYRVHQS